MSHFTVTFDQFNAFLQNKIIHVFKNTHKHDHIFHYLFSVYNF